MFGVHGNGGGSGNDTFRFVQEGFPLEPTAREWRQHVFTQLFGWPLTHSPSPTVPLILIGRSSLLCAPQFYKTVLESGELAKLGECTRHCVLSFTPRPVFTVVGFRGGLIN